MVYGAEAVLPTDREYGSPRLKAYQEQRNQELRENSLDQVDEARDVALIHSARYQQSLRRYQSQRVRRRDLCEGDLVLRLRQNNRGVHKLTPPWEGPYIVAKVLKPGTYKLANAEGEVFTNAWNIQQLRSPSVLFFPQNRTHETKTPTNGHTTLSEPRTRPRKFETPSGATMGGNT